MKKSVIVTGSGISGLAVSKMLQENFSVTVLEKAPEKGGLIKCRRVNGNLFHLVGGHVFNSKNETVLAWFWQFFDKDKEFLKASRNAKIFLNGRVTGYPVEDFIYELPEEILRKVINELLQIVAQKKDPRSEGNFETFLKNSFGETLYDIYFGPYNSKLWNTDLSKVPLDWLDGKLPMPDVTEIIVNNILKKKKTQMVHASFYYPVKDGSQFIIDRLSENTDIEVGSGVRSVSYNNSLLINDNKQADHLVYCGDVRQLHSIVQIEDETLKQALGAVKDLPSNGTSNVLCETDDNDISWLYLPEKKFAAHRIIYTGNFSDTNNAGSRKTCVVEFSGKQDEAAMRRELTQLPGNLQAIAFNYEPNSYIIQFGDTREKISALKAALAKYNIYLLGRFAEWEYYNMDKCIESAMAISNHLSK
jgi:protoporphyrinogen oxidase